jgi:hypothetical protein
MDEPEIVNRRDAIAGLSLLSVLMIALVGVIFYRIVNPSPAKTVSLDELTVAPRFNDAAPPAADQPPASMGHDSARQNGGVSAAAYSSELPDAGKNPGASPHFIAPAPR